MSVKDELHFLNFIHSERPVKVLPYYQGTTGKVQLCDAFPTVAEWWYSCYLWDKENSPEPTLKFIPQQNHYLTDEDNSELIQFERTNIFEKKCKITHGRIFINNKVWRDGCLVERPRVFLEWFEKLANWIRKNGLYRVAPCYVFPGMKEFLDNHPDYVLD